MTGRTGSRRPRGLMAALTATALGLVGLPLAAGPAAAATCTSGVPGDVNGDGYAEVAVSQRRPPSVNVFYGHPTGLQVNAKGAAHDDQVFSQSTKGIPGSTSTHDGFGRATTFGDFNGDGCADLAIGNTDDIDDGSSVTVLYGSPRGLTTAGLTRLRPVGGELDDFQGEFGAKLGSGDLTGDGIDELVVGVPGAIDTGSDRGDGALVVYTGGTAGLSGAIDRRIPLTALNVVGLYASLIDFAIGDFDGNGRAELAVNTPDTSVVSFGADGQFLVRSDVADGGGVSLVAGDTNGDGRDDLAAIGGDFGQSVILLSGSPTGLGAANSREWSAADVGLGDSQGLTVTMGPLDSGSTADLVIGGPGTKVGSADGAGGVAVLFGGAGGPTLDHRLRLSEASTGVPGSAEEYDLFGASVATAFVQGAGRASLLVSAPRDDDGSRTDAGRFYVFPQGAAGPQASGSRAITLNTSGVKGRSAKSSRFGIALGVGAQHL